MIYEAEYSIEYCKKFKRNALKLNLFSHKEMDFQLIFMSFQIEHDIRAQAKMKKIEIQLHPK